MTTEQIEKFISLSKHPDTPVKINFKTRNSVIGVFIQTPDFEELKSKNFWRIVSEANLNKWKKSRDYTLCRMYNGAEFTKLVAVQE
jgi:hypothetical protein